MTASIKINFTDQLRNSQYVTYRLCLLWTWFLLLFLSFYVIKHRVNLSRFCVSISPCVRVCALAHSEPRDVSRVPP
jgi:hypothetical protein